MSRPSTSLTVAIWGAVLGCCVWSVQVSQAAAGVTVDQEWIHAQTNSEAGRSHELNSRARSFASLGFWSVLLHAQSPEVGQITLQLATNILPRGEEPRDCYIRTMWPNQVSEQNTGFAVIRNRWSHGFH